MSPRESIKSGDLLIWSKNIRNSKSNFYLNLIRFFTRSEYAHVAVAWILEGRLFIVEATEPVLRITPVKDYDEFYHLSMDVSFTKESEDWLIDKIGLTYSIMDAIRAYLGKTVKNDRRYQCAELSNEFYKFHNIDLGDAFTPTAIVSKALFTRNESLRAIAALETK